MSVWAVVCLLVVVVFSLLAWRDLDDLDGFDGAVGRTVYGWSSTRATLTSAAPL